MDASQQQQNMMPTRQTRTDNGFFSPLSYAVVAAEEAVVVVDAQVRQA